MAASRAAVEVFLKALHSMDQDKFVMSNQRKTIDFLALIDWGKSELVDTLMALTVNDYCTGPLKNDWGDGSAVWTFGAEITVNETTIYRVYIKLSLSKSRAGNTFANLSFHPPERSMFFPLAKPYKQWEVAKDD